MQCIILQRQTEVQRQAEEQKGRREPHLHHHYRSKLRAPNSKLRTPSIQTKPKERKERKNGIWKRNSEVKLELELDVELEVEKYYKRKQDGSRIRAQIHTHAHTLSLGSGATSASSPPSSPLSPPSPWSSFSTLPESKSRALWQRVLERLRVSGRG